MEDKTCIRAKGMKKKILVLSGRDVLKQDLVDPERLFLPDLNLSGESSIAN